MGLKFASNLEDFELAILEGYWDRRKEFETTLRQGNDGTEKHQMICKIVKALNEIYEESNEDYKKLIDMRYGLGEEFEEIADEIGKTMYQVRGFNRRILDKLAIKLGWVWQ